MTPTYEQALVHLNAINARIEKQRAAAHVAREVGRQYELQVVTHHKTATGETVWHNEVIPEEELFQCGFIHDYNHTRLVRLAIQAQAKAREGPRYRDYGMDFLSRDADGVYHAGQAKYRSRGHIGANDLGTFLNVVNNRLRSTGYIYTTVPLEVNLREDVLNSQFSVGKLVHHRLALAPAEAADAPEIEYALRPYQRQAVDAICERRDADENRMALLLFCGGGKTLVAGHALRRMDFALYVAIAPLKLSVDQLRTRLAPFLPNHEVLLVDSDEGGTTDLEEVRAAVNSGKNLAIFSTFKSAEGVLAHVGGTFQQDAFLLVDEVHNLVSNDALVAFVDGFAHSLMLSATLPEELFERTRVRKVFEFGMADAIREKYCCDYRVYLPLIEQVETANGGTKELLAGDDPTLAAKALFLVTGMLERGSRRCIAYMGDKAECDAFLNVLTKVVETHHGLDFWGGKICDDVRRSDRERLLREFQAGDDRTLRILASVRILDEAIDIVRCDSTFVSHVGEDASDIRTVQRMCRGIRLDSRNAEKINTLFLWTEDHSKALAALSLLRTMDPTFHTKVRVSRIEYDGGGERAVRDIVIVKTGQLADYVRVTCLTLEELFAWKMEVFKRFRAAHPGRMPTQKETFGDEKHKVGQWLSTYRSQRATMGTERRAALDAALPGWDVIDEVLSAGLKAALPEAEKMAVFARFRTAHPGRMPTQKETFGDEKHKVGQWLSTYRSQRTTMGAERRAALDAALPGWDVIDEAVSAGLKAALPEAEKMAVFARFRAAHPGRMPTRKETFGDEKHKVGAWLSQFRCDRTTMGAERRAALDAALPGWDVIDEAVSAGLKGALPEAEKMAVFERFRTAHPGRMPTSKETFGDEKHKVGAWLSQFRSQRATMGTERRAALDAALPGWDVIDEAKSAGLKAALPEAEKMAVFARFRAAHPGRMPTFKETFGDEKHKVGKWLSTYRSQRATMGAERRAALDAALPGWDVVKAAAANKRAAITQPA